MNTPQEKPSQIYEADGQSAPELPASPPSSEPTDTTLADFLQRQTQHRIESAEAFEQDNTSEPSMRELLEEQVKLQRQIRGTKNQLTRMQQSLMICQFLNVLIAGTLVAIAAFVYLQPDVANAVPGARESTGAWLQGDGTQPSQLPPRTGQTPTASPEQVLMIRNFLGRAMNTRVSPQDGPLEKREKQSSYISLLVDLSEKAEELAPQNGTKEVCEILVKLAKYAKGNQSYENNTVEQMELRKEILRFCRMD